MDIRSNRFHELYGAQIHRDEADAADDEEEEEAQQDSASEEEADPFKRRVQVRFFARESAAKPCVCRSCRRRP